MPFQVVSDTVSVRFEYVFGTIPIITTFHVRDVELGWTAVKMDTLAAAMEAWWDAASGVRSLQVDDLTLSTIVIRDLGDEFGLQKEYDVSLAGEVATAPLPPSLAAIVHYTGDSGSPPRKGTIFHPGLAEAQVVDTGLLDGTFRTAVEDAYDSLRAGVLSGSEALVILSRYSGSTLVTHEDGTVTKKPTPRTPAVTNTTAGTSVPSKPGILRNRRD